MARKKLIDANCIKCMRLICIEDGGYRYCGECMPEKVRFFDPADYTKSYRITSDMADACRYLSNLKESEVSTIPKKSLFRFAVVKSIRNADLVIVNQELIDSGVILAVNENDARVRVGKNITLADVDDVEVTVVSF